MKYIKIYESIKKPQIGDYAFVEPSEKRFGLSKEWRDYLKCHVGNIIEKYYYTYKIEFDTTDGFTQILSFRLEEIIDFSSNKEDLEYVKNSKKYNL